MPMTALDWPDFYFARHGETDWNREQRYQGSRDIPLNRKGQMQADSNGVLLREMLERDGVDPTSLNWFASPLSRASETMDRMRAAFDVELPPVVHDKRLIEISFGAFEGRLHAEIAREQTALAPGERDESYWHFRPQDGENYDDVAVRLLDFARELTHHAVVVAHGGVLRVLWHLVEGTSRKEVMNWPPPQGVIAHFVGGKMALHKAKNTWDAPVD
ncbi:histidine phosphatase family protein [Devosia sp.]|uniref:histidine phosphatase family protein n=1 Tax=Devosia sp. TaxID=1871048 RepID=UPI001B10EB37|nr:histidine phosphatase family protein [Devosia sp.]MBO9589210.1 histidine phosphatase family protein [Devosia sp.]